MEAWQCEGCGGLRLLCYIIMVGGMVDPWRAGICLIVCEACAHLNDSLSTVIFAYNLYYVK